VDPFNAAKFKKYLMEGQVHDNINFELMKYVWLVIRKQIVYFFNMSTKAAYILAKLCDIWVIYLNNINIVNSYFKENTLQFLTKKRLLVLYKKSWVFSELYETY